MQHQFYDRIAQLVYTFPEDATTSSGARFWSAPKRFPHALTFDPRDPTHASLVQSAAILKAESCAIHAPKWAADATQVLPCAQGVEMALHDQNIQPDEHSLTGHQEEPTAACSLESELNLLYMCALTILLQI